MRIKPKIIGFIVSIALLIQLSPSTYAIYSPVLSAEISIIKNNVQAAKSVHGVFNFKSAYDRIDDPNKNLFNHFTDVLKGIFIDQLTDRFLDGWLLLIREFGIGGTMTTCLRDDIWEIQALQEAVINELLKTALLSDYAMSDQLWKDYQKLGSFINGPAELPFEYQGIETTATFNGLWKDYRKSGLLFPSSQNFYINCPYGEFKQAFDDLERSFDNLTNTFSKDIQQGTLAEQAKKRAKESAAEWIKKNQITMTFGGEQGSNPRSLVNGPGLSGLVADLETELEIVKSLGELVFVDTYKAIAEAWEGNEDVNTILMAYDTALKQKELVLDQAENIAVLNLQLNNVSEESLKNIESILFQINEEIRRAYETKTSDANLLNFCNNLSSVAKNMCKNHAGATPKCNQ